MSNPGILFPKKEIRRFCWRYRVQQIILFDPILHNVFQPYSSLDILVVFSPITRDPFYQLNKMEHELSMLFQRPVDLVSLEGMTLAVREEANLPMTEVYAL